VPRSRRTQQLYWGVSSLDSRFVKEALTRVRCSAHSSPPPPPSEGHHAQRRWRAEDGAVGPGDGSQPYRGAASQLARGPQCLRGLLRALPRVSPRRVAAAPPAPPSTVGKVQARAAPPPAPGCQLLGQAEVWSRSQSGPVPTPGADQYDLRARCREQKGAQPPSVREGSSDLGTY